MTLTFDLLSLDLELLWHFGRHVSRPVQNVSEIEQSAAELLTISHIFAVQFLGAGHFLRTVLRDAWTELHQTWREHREIIAAHQICFTVQISCC